jgi:hypothetical protein
MKTLSTLLLVLSIAYVKAQTNPATPNANFENWTHYTPQSQAPYDSPNGWTSLNSFTDVVGFITCYKDSTKKISGKYSVLLLTMPYGSGVAPGTITTGTINPFNQTINGGIPYNLRPDSIMGWYQYTSVSGDNADIEFYLFGANHTDTIGQAFVKTPASNVSSWTRFSLPVKYAGSSAPDTALWIITSSDNQVSGHAGSQLIVDSFGLVFNTKTGINNISNAENIKVGPNPTTGLISINNNSNTQSAIFTLFDLTGRKVAQGKIAQGTNYMELTGVSEGVYIYSIQDEGSSVLKTGKIVVEN